MTLASNIATYNVFLDASPEHVWAVVRAFARVADWHPIAKASRLVAGRDGEPGAERELTLTDGGAVRERLVAIDETGRRLVYSMVTFPIPVTAQENVLQVDVTGTPFQSQVTFSAMFTPSPGHSEGEIRAINLAAFEMAARGLTERLRDGGAVASAAPGLPLRRSLASRNRAILNPHRK